MSILEKLSKINARSFQSEYESKLNPNNSYFLGGETGTGKTFEALQLAKNIEKQGKDVYFIQFYELIKTAQNSFGNNHESWLKRELLRDLGEWEVLILDDVGTEKNTEFVDQIVYELIDTRYQNELQTVFTSNFSLEEIKEKYHSRIADRIVGMCGKENIIEFTGESKR